MEARQLNELLLEAFPELKGEFDHYTSWQDGIDTGCFLTYEDLLLPLARQALEQKDEKTIGRVAAFIERLLGLDDDYAENVATVALLEGLKAGHGGIARARLGERGSDVYDML